MFLNKALLLLLALHLYSVVCSQDACTGSLRGNVLDAHGHPLFGAAILLTPGGIGQSTTADGGYYFDDLCAQQYEIKIHYVGFKEFSTVLNITGDMRKNFILEEEVTELHEVVIMHHDAANTEHATNYSIVNERKLAESAGKTLGETLKDLPGVASIQAGPGIFKPVIHGLHSQRLLILNHGIRQEGQQWGIEHAPEIDPFIASNIVVIKDAAAIKYGPEALGGVIVVNPAPLPLTNDLGGTATTVAQSNGRSGILSAMLEGGLANHKGFGWRVQGTARRSGDFKAPNYYLTNTGVKELNFSASAGYHANKLGLDIFFSRFQTELGILRGTSIENLDDLVAAMERPVPLYTSDFSYEIGEPRQTVSHNLLKLNGHMVGSWGEWRSQYGFQNNNRKEFDMRIGNLSKTPAIDLQLNTHTFDNEWETHHSHVRTFSLGFNSMYQDNKNIPGTQRIPFIPNFISVSGGVFGTAKFFFSRWTLNGGVRYDYRTYDVKGFDFKNTFYSATFDFGNVSGSLGATLKIGGSRSMNFNVSSSWRPPHVSELYSMGTHQSAAAIEYGLMLDSESNEVMDINAASFSPEQGVKVVASYQINKEKLQFNITPFVNKIFNYIYLRPEGITRNVRGVYPYFRYAQADAIMLGVDVDATIRLHDKFYCRPAVSLLKVQNVIDRTYFLFIPSNRYSLDLRYEDAEFIGLKNAWIESKVQYVARQLFSPRVVPVRQIQEAEESGADPFNGDASVFDFTEAPPAYVRWNVAAGISIKGEKNQYDIRLACDNVLNQSYREYTNRFRYFADELGRNVILSVKCIF